MAALILPNRLTQQPQYVARVDSKSAPNFAVGVVGNNLYDFVNNVQAFIAGTTTFTPTVDRIDAVFNGTATSYARLYGPASAYDILGPLTLMWVGSISDVATYNMLITRSFSNGATNNPFELRLNPSGGVQILRANAAGYSAFISTANVPINTPVVIIVQSDNTGTNFFINGNYEHSTGIIAYPTSAGNLPLSLGRRDDGSYSTNHTALAVGWPRILSRKEVDDLTANPWQLFQAPRRKLYLAASSAGPTTGTLAVTESPDIIAASGGVAVSGSLAITESADTVSASGGVLVSGSLVVTETPDTIVASGGVLVSGSLAISEAPDSVSAGGTLANTNAGSLAVTELPDTVSASGGVLVSGALLITESPDTISGAGSIPFVVSGSAALLEASELLVAAGLIFIKGNIITMPLDIITNAVIDIGALAPGEPLEPALAQFAFNTLNDLLDQWSNEGLMIFNNQEIVATLTPGKYIYSVGNGGEINTIRPLGIKSAFVRINNLDYPVEVIPLERYELIGLKTQSGPWPRALYYNLGAPLSQISFWPNPSSGEIHLFADLVFSSFATINDVVNLPQGFNMALRHNLASLLLPAYGKTADPLLVQKIEKMASAGKAYIKGTNINPTLTARFDAALTTTRRADAGWILNGGFS